MKQKTGIILLIMCALSTILLGFVCLSVYGQKHELQKKADALESEYASASEAAETAAETEETQEPETPEPETAFTETEETETPEETETETETETAAPETEPAAMYTVAIDPGHQGSWVNMSDLEPMGPGSSEMKAKASTGTTGAYTGIPEYQLNLDISLALRTELENRGYRVVLAREDNDTAISNAERALLAYNEGGDIYVRIHANGSDDHSVSGALGMVPSTSNPYVAYLAEDSLRLGECILNAYCAETGFGNLGVQYYDNMTGINWSQIPVMILEMGFMTNESDDYNMADASMRQRMVTGIANGIDDYFGRRQ